jgi:hypothetical protein
MEKELTYSSQCKRGDQGDKVKNVQEWLSLNGKGVGVDGDFGAATEKAVIRFQRSKGLDDDGVVGKKTFPELIAPMMSALQIIPSENKTFNQLVTVYAKQHLKTMPLEIGGQNCGPWVRLYTRGYEGEDYPWCAGFVSFIMRQAADTLAVPPPLKYTLSCDDLAAQAKGKGIFIRENDIVTGAVKKSDLMTGYIFLVRKTGTDWTHTGLVTKFDEETFQTIEGNTNDSGDREGYEVCARTRSYGNRDFIKI